jgi:hypothetical protein
MVLMIKNQSGKRSFLRGMRKVKKEVAVATENLDRDFFVSIIGPLHTWFDPTAPYTEWDMMRKFSKEPKQWWRLAKLLTEDLLSIFIIPMGFVLMARSRFIFRNKVNTTSGDQYAENNALDNEDWWYVNGIGVNGDLQKTNSDQMAEMFGRQIHNFYNPTQGLLFDLFLCMTGLTGHKTHAAKQLTLVLIERLKSDPNRTVNIICHSGGVIVATNAVRKLIKHGHVSDLKRLEIYTFGSPVTDYPYAIDPDSYDRVPYYEHYVNTGDYVSRIGTLRIKDTANWRYVGKIYAADIKGHFFGEHYLANLSRHKYAWRDQDGEGSRLYKKLQQREQTKV